MNKQFKQGPYQIVELKVTSAGTVQNFPDEPQLRNDGAQKIWIKMIELITVNVLGHSVSDSTIVNAPLTELIKATLVLYDRGWNKVYQLPLLLLNHMASDPAAFIPFTRDIREFNDLDRVDWNKSQVIFTNAPAPTYSIMLGVSYARQAIDQQTGKLAADTLEQ